MSNARENVNLLTSADWDIAALRLANWGSGAVPPQVMLKQNWVAGDGGGLFRYDASDTTTADNGGTVIVDAAGNRWKRQYSDDVSAAWFNCRPGRSAADNAAALTAALAVGSVRLPAVGTYALAPITIPSERRIYGEGARATITHANASALFVCGSYVEVANIIIFATGATAPAFRLPTSTTAVQQIYLTDIELDDCPGVIADDNGANTADEIYLTDVISYRNRGSGVLFRDVFAFAFFTRVTIDFNASSSTNHPGFSIANNEGVIFEQCDVLGAAASAAANRGFEIQNGTSAWFNRVMPDNCGAAGMWLSNVWYVQIESSRASGCFGHGVHCLNDSRYVQGFVQVVGRKALASPPANIDAVRIEGASLHVGMSVFAFSVTGHGLHITGSAGRCAVATVEVTDTTGDGVRLNDADYVTIGAVTAHTLGGEGVHVLGGSYSCAFGGGVVRAAGGAGLRVSGNSNSAIVFGPFSITGCTGRGISEAGTGNSAIFSGSYTLSNTAGNYDIAGGFVHINGLGVNSGGYLATATGPASG